MIIVDTSGRHKQQDDLFEEMLQVSNTVVSFFFINTTQFFLISIFSDDKPVFAYLK